MAGKFYGLCQWCQKEQIKTKGYKTCSRSCGSSLRWFKMKNSGKLLIFHRLSEFAKKTKYCQRIKAECERHCKDLGIQFTNSILRLYTRARNRGYLNGYSTASRRRRA